MTNDQLEAIYKENVAAGHITALRMLYNHGWYDGAGKTPTATFNEKSREATAPTVIMKAKARID